MWQPQTRFSSVKALSRVAAVFSTGSFAAAAAILLVFANSTMVKSLKSGFLLVFFRSVT